MKLAINAINIRGGGGLTHLTEIVKELDTLDTKFNEIHVWTSPITAGKLEFTSKKIVLHSPKLLDRSLIVRIAWAKIAFPTESSFCNICFVPGGGACSFNGPIVTMCRNLLPFEKHERQRYSWFSLLRYRWEVLRVVQGKGFKSADGIIFLTEYARNTVLSLLNINRANTVTINHGVSSIFERVKEDRPEECATKTFKFIYVSTVSLYKHHLNVAKAIYNLRNKGINVSIDFYGKGERQAVKKLRRAIASFGIHSKYITYHGPVSYEDLPNIYSKADGFIYASSCENMPNILIEAMSIGLPICCSNLGPMPEILKDAGLYFQPEKINEIEASALSLIESCELRAQLSKKAVIEAQKYSWKKCARRTTSFVSSFYIRD